MIFFRIDLNIKHGLGHYRRIKSLIRYLDIKKYKIVIDKLPSGSFFKEEKKNIISLYESNNYFINEKDDASFFLKKIKDKNNSAVVVKDSYRLGYIWEKHIYKHFKKVISIDDLLEDKHFVDIYINHSPSFLNKNEGVTLILGDNIYSGANDILTDAFLNFSSGGTVFGYRVEDPERYGVVEMSGNKVLSIEEKPKKPKSNYAIPGLYIFDYEVIEIAEKLKPSKRGELEITDVIKAYLRDDTLSVFKLPRGTVWLDAGTSSSLFDSSAYVQAIEKRQGIKIGCPEEATYNQGNINKTQLRKLIKNIPNSEYKNYLSTVLKYE